MKYYAIADLHGRFDLLKKAWDVILDEVAGTFDYKIITLGDYVDRGPESKQIIDFLMSVGQYPDVVSLQGNHEAMMVQNIVKKLNLSWWLGNGGDATLESYGSRWPYSTAFVPEEHIKWMASLPLYYETEKQVFVHAGVPFDEGSLEEQSKHNYMGEYPMQWMLYNETDSGGYQGKHVVHGHHQFADGPHQWQGRTDLDCYTWRTGRLVIGVFDDTQGPAKKFLEVLGDDYGDQRDVDV